MGVSRLPADRPGHFRLERGRCCTSPLLAYADVDTPDLVECAGPGTPRFARRAKVLHRSISGHPRSLEPFWGQRQKSVSCSARALPCLRPARAVGGRVD